MPYITQEARERLLETGDPENAGELNFTFTEVAIAYFYKHGHNYAAINDILGALDGAGKEFYRRIAAPYEDTKIKINGDVYVS